MNKLIVLALLLTGCYKEQLVCDQPAREAMFLKCLEIMKASNPTSINTAGNDADEIVSECNRSALSNYCAYRLVKINGN